MALDTWDLAGIVLDGKKAEAVMRQLRERDGSLFEKHGKTQEALLHAKLESEEHFAIRQDIENNFHEKNGRKIDWKGMMSVFVKTSRNPTGNVVGDVKYYPSGNVGVRVEGGDLMSGTYDLFEVPQEG